MLGTYYYHEIIRKTIISFGTLFNNINIKHKKSDGTILDDIKVGLAYGPQQKYLAKIQEQAELSKAVAITLPRMSFEMTNIQYDSTRKSGITQTFKAKDGDNIKKVFMPVPYNIGFELSIFSKLNDDALQIIEQILPFFQPSFNLTVDLVSSIGERDIPVVLEKFLSKMIMKDLLKLEGSDIYTKLYCKNLSVWSSCRKHGGTHQKSYCRSTLWNKYTNRKTRSQIYGCPRSNRCRAR